MNIHCFLNYLHGPKKGLILSFLKGSLYSLSLFVKLGVKAKNIYYNYALQKHRFKPSHSFVISIGNIVAGGTGKTPLTMLLAKKLLEKQKKIAVLSRGYGSQLEKKARIPVLISSETGPRFTPKICGDEPYLICQRIPQLHFYVGKNRRSSKEMAEKLGASIVILDDGMQYRKLKRDLEIVILDAKDPLGKSHYLPRGFLREDPKSLKRADLIVFNHVDSQKDFAEAKKLLSRWTKAPAIALRPIFKKLISIKTKQTVHTAPKKIAAFCAIAKPFHFYALLTAQGFEVVDQLSLRDHAKIEEAELKRYCEKAIKLGAECIVCTEKDAVKLTPESFQNFPVAYVEMDLQIVFGKRVFEEFLSHIP